MLGSENGGLVCIVVQQLPQAAELGPAKTEPVGPERLDLEVPCAPFHPRGEGDRREGVWEVKH